MSGRGEQIICRNCKETIAVEDQHCPHCGKSIRSDRAYLIAILLGVLLIIATLFSPGDLLAFGILGVVLVAGAGYLLYEKRQRIDQASE